jgi:hypothetical protein
LIVRHQSLASTTSRDHGAPLFLSGFVVETDTCTGSSGASVKLRRLKSFVEEPLKQEIAQESALDSTPNDCEPLHLEMACSAINAVFTLASMVSSRCYPAIHA